MLLLDRFAASVLPWRQQRFVRKPAPEVIERTTPLQRVLVLGIYLTDRPNTASHLIERYSASRRHQTTQRWAALGHRAGEGPLLPHTAVVLTERIPKFALLNRLIHDVDLSTFDYIIVSDDDVTVAPNFLDAYLGWVHKYRLSIAQPARTRYSYRSHAFVLQQPLLRARETNFVEIGPVFSFDRHAAQALLPFDESSPMGWGYDYVWPAIMGRLGHRMGIVDATPVDHSYRPQGNTYDYREEHRVMAAYLSQNPHIPHDRAFRNLRLHFR